jgi:cyclase
MHRRNMFFGSLALSALALAQGPAPAPLMVHQLKPNVYWIEGGGGNSGVIVGDKGVIVVDAKTTPAAGKQLLDEIAKITPKPVTAVIETHSDGDHVNGLASFPTGITIIAHENNKKEQDTALAAGGRGAPPAGHLPTQSIAKNKDDLKIVGEKIQVLHWANAHTSGDLVVFLPSEKIVFTGDIISTGPDALIHLEKNGSSEGWITTAKGIGALNAEQFVPGHGNVQTKAEIQKKATDVAAKRAKIKDLVAQGKSLADIKTAVGDPPPAQGKGGGKGGPAFPSFTEVVYQELTKKGA